MARNGWPACSGISGRHQTEYAARLRKARGLTQTELAERIGIIQTLVSDYETENLRLSAEMAARFAQALSVSLDELMGLKIAKKKAAAKVESGELSLKLVRRLKGIERKRPVTTVWSCEWIAVNHARVSTTKR